MKKLFYVFVVIIMFVICWPLIIINKDKWNEVGENIDEFFQIKSPHTRLKN